MTVRSEEAAFYRTALLLGLIRGNDVIRWADAVIGAEPAAPAALLELATTSPDDLSALRERLFEAGGGGESPAMIRRVIGLIHGDLASGRRSFHDTMTVLKQLRAFVKVDRELNEHLKMLGVGVAIAAPGSDARA